MTGMCSTEAQTLYDALRANGIIGAEGRIQLELLGARVDVNDKSAVGNLLQEWLGRWMTQNGIYNRVNQNSQMFPDFYLSEDNRLGLLEVKTFDHATAPNFDVAQFDAYVRALRTDAHKLDADYLIFGYSLSNGVIKIQDIWLKKIWEITCASKGFPLRTNVKQHKIHNVRPYNFKNNSRGFQPFGSRLAFVQAIHDTLVVYVSQEFADEWLLAVGQSYTDFAKTQL